MDDQLYAATMRALPALYTTETPNLVCCFSGSKKLFPTSPAITFPPL